MGPSLRELNTSVVYLQNLGTDSEFSQPQDNMRIMETQKDIKATATAETYRKGISPLSTAEIVCIA